MGNREVRACCKARVEDGEGRFSARVEGKTFDMANVVFAAKLKLEG